MLHLLFGSRVHKKYKWLFSKHEAVFLFNLFFDNTVHFLMAVVYNDLCKGITVQKYLLFWQYGFFNPIHTNGGHQMTLWLDDGADRVNIDCFFMPLANCMKNDFGTDFWDFWMAQLNGRSRFHWYFMTLQLLFGYIKNASIVVW